ncbi:MAG: TonB-dependent receptor [Candidatus Margulisiibacteriota bacterium]
MGLSGTFRKADYSFWLSKSDSSGISKARGGSERDGYSNATFSSRFGYQLLDNTKLNLILRSTYADYDIDNGAYDDDPNYTLWSRDIAGKIELEQAINAWWNHRIAFNYYNLGRKYRNERDTVHTALSADTQNWFKGDNKKIEWQNNFNLSDWDTLTAGWEYEKDRGSSYSRSGATVTKFDRRSLDNYGYYLQNQLKIGKRLFITPGIRVDDYDIFGKQSTYKVSTSYLFSLTSGRIKANIGTGFKSPSLFQLYSSFGDPNLGPDKSLSYDLGLEQGVFDNKLSLGVTYFHNKFENMVDFDSATSKYKNIGRAKTNGWEAEFSFKPGENLELGMNYTYTATEDEQTGKELARRPKNQASLNINWAFIPKADLNLSLAYKGHNWNNAANTQKVEPYARIDLGFTYAFHKNFNFFTRIENLLDRRYEDVRGFNAMDRSFSAGIKATF